MHSCKEKNVLLKVKERDIQQKIYLTQSKQTFMKGNKINLNKLSKLYRKNEEEEVK